MNDITRWEMYADTDDIVSAGKVENGDWVLHSDHIKAMEAKQENLKKIVDSTGKTIQENQATIEAQDKEIERMDRAFREKIKRINSRHDAITFKQEKEIERLRGAFEQLINYCESEFDYEGVYHVTDKVQEKIEELLK